MPLGAAHRLAPEALFLDPEPAADAAAMKAALDRIGGFSPGVAAETDPAKPGFGRVEVQLDGLEQLWGPDPVLVRRMDEALAGILPGPPLAGIAGTRFAAAVAAALAGRTRGVAGRGSEPGEWRRRGSGPRPGPRRRPATRSHSTLPNVARTRHFSRHFRRPCSAAIRRCVPGSSGSGCASSARSRSCRGPRSWLGSGRKGEWLHARARGEETDPFRPHQAPERMAMALPIDPPVSDVEGLRFVLHRLAAAFGDQLEARGAATSRARLTLELDRSFAVGDVPPSITIDQLLPEPTSEGLAIERLLIARLEVSRPGARYREWTSSWATSRRPRARNSRSSRRRRAGRAGSAGSWPGSGSASARSGSAGWRWRIWRRSWPRRAGSGVAPRP